MTIRNFFIGCGFAGILKKKTVFCSFLSYQFHAQETSCLIRRDLMVHLYRAIVTLGRHILRGDFMRKSSKQSAGKEDFPSQYSGLLLESG
jgi:hypothetical protein